MSHDTMTAADWAICVTYLIIAAGFFTALVIGERRERRCQRIEIETGIARLEQYANTGKASL